MIRLTPADRRQLQTRAEAEGRTAADLARHLLRQALTAGQEVIGAR